MDESTLASTKKRDEELFDTITYRKQGSNWYALSGYQGDNILYVKSWVGVGATNRLSLDYPTRLKTTYDGGCELHRAALQAGGFGGNALMSL